MLNPLYTSPPSPVAGPSGVRRKPFECSRCTIYDDGSSHIHAFDNKIYQRGIPLEGEQDPLEVLKNNRDKIMQHISNALEVKGSISTQIHLIMQLKKTEKDGETTTSSPSFNSSNRRVLNMGEFDDMYKEATNKILESVGNHMKEGSGWQIEKVIKLNLLVSENYPIRVGKYIPPLPLLVRRMPF